MSSKARRFLKRFFMDLPYLGSAHFLSALPLVRLELEQHPHAVGLDSRFAMYARIASRLQGRAVCYLEFGVWQGASIAEWARIVPNADSRFVGFDSFEGLPDDWDHAFQKTRKGTFTTGGRLPDVKDARVSFVKGWFTDSLPGFLRTQDLRERQLIVHLDADLYSSTAFVLHQLNALMPSGTVLIFDEFGNPLHEYRALKDWATICDRRYRIDFFVQDTYDQVALTVL